MKPCRVPNIKTQLVDEIAWEWLYGLLTNRGLLKSKIENYIDELQKVILPLKERYAIISHSIDKKQNEHTQMSLSYHKLPELAQAKILAELEAIEGRIKEDQIELGRLEEKMSKLNHRLGWLLDEANPNSHLRSIGWYDNGEPDESNDTLEDLSFEEKLDYITKYDVRGVITTDDMGDQWIRLMCIFGDEFWSKLYTGS